MSATSGIKEELTSTIVELKLTASCRESAYCRNFLLGKSAQELTPALLPPYLFAGEDGASVRLVADNDGRAMFQGAAITVLQDLVPFEGVGTIGENKEER